MKIFILILLQINSTFATDANEVEYTNSILEFTQNASMVAGVFSILNVADGVNEYRANTPEKAPKAIAIVINDKNTIEQLGDLKDEMAMAAYEGDKAKVDDLVKKRTRLQILARTNGFIEEIEIPEYWDHFPNNSDVGIGRVSARIRFNSVFEKQGKQLLEIRIPGMAGTEEAALAIRSSMTAKRLGSVRQIRNGLIGLAVSTGVALGSAAALDDQTNPAVEVIPSTTTGGGL